MFRLVAMLNLSLVLLGVEMVPRGFTLLELLLGLALSTLVISAAAMLLSGVWRQTALSQQSARLDAEMLLLASLLVTDLRRIGYRETSTSLVTPGVFSLPREDCVLFGYDRYADGAIATNEYFGFKRQQVDGVGVLRVRRSANSTSSCLDGSWESVSDPALIDIKRLVFTPRLIDCVALPEGERGACNALKTHYPGRVSGWYRIEISMVAHARDDPRRIRTLQTTVTLRAPQALLP